MSKISYMTQEAYDKFCEDIDLLKTDGRRECADAIAEARDKGDLSENAEYDAAKNAQGMLEARINGMEISLAYTKIISLDDIDTSQVSILTTVKVKNKKINKEFSYKIVSPAEADIKKKKISVSSPIGEGLLGKKVGEIVDIQTPAGIMQLEILNISL